MDITSKRFDNYDDYLLFLKDRTSCNNPEYTANHEREHLEQARRLGYDAVYAVQYVGNDFPHIVTAAFVDFPTREPTKKDLIKILLAPTEPGEEDVALAKKLRMELSSHKTS